MFVRESWHLLVARRSTREFVSKKTIKGGISSLNDCLYCRRLSHMPALSGTLLVGDLLSTTMMDSKSIAKTMTKVHRQL